MDKTVKVELEISKAALSAARITESEAPAELKRTVMRDHASGF